MLRMIGLALALSAAPAAAQTNVERGLAVVLGMYLAAFDAALACDPDAFERRRFGHARGLVTQRLGTLPPLAAAIGYERAAEVARQIAGFAPERRCAEAHYRAAVAANSIERGI